MNVNDDPVNYRVYRMSKAAGCDLRPLIHFWGIKPATNYRKDLIPTPEALEDSINNAGLKPSRLNLLTDLCIIVMKLFLKSG
mgnify:CR=1 FL=1